MARALTKQQLGLRVLGAMVVVWVIKAAFFGPKRHKVDDEIAQASVFERITSGTPLGSSPLDPQKHPFLQSRLGREADTVTDIFDPDIAVGLKDFWTRFQLPFMTARETVHLDEQVIKATVEELMSFNGWAAAACTTLARPFAGRKEDAYADLNGPGRLYYFGLVVHSADHFYIDQLAVIIQISRKLGTQHIFVSVLDYASSDSTPFLSDLTEAVLTLLGVPFRVRRVAPMTEDPSASYYPHEEAYTRNLALEPLYELYQRRKVVFTRVIWLKGFTCPNDLLETLRVSLVNRAALVCSMDWKEHNGFFIYNDRWRTRDLDGNLFRGSKSTSPVFCCESGSHVVDPAQSYYAGIQYRAAPEGTVFNASRHRKPDEEQLRQWSDGPCMDSSQMHFCRDLWLEAAKNGVKDEAREAFRRQRSGKERGLSERLEEVIRVVAPKLSAPVNPLAFSRKPANAAKKGAAKGKQGNVHLSGDGDDSPQADFDKTDMVGAARDVDAAVKAEKAEDDDSDQPVVEDGAKKKVGGKPLPKGQDMKAKRDFLHEREAASAEGEGKAQPADPLKAAPAPKQDVSEEDDQEEGDWADPDDDDFAADDGGIPHVTNAAFKPARILVNPRCITTYAGVSHTQLALDLFGDGADDAEPVSREGGRYHFDDWTGAPNAFVCQEMRATGGRISSKQQRRTKFVMSKALREGWKVGDAV